MLQACKAATREARLSAVGNLIAITALNTPWAHRRMHEQAPRAALWVLKRTQVRRAVLRPRVARWRSPAADPARQATGGQVS